jgi:hypothetical protein
MGVLHLVPLENSALLNVLQYVSLEVLPSEPLPDLPVSLQEPLVSY